MKIRSGCEGGGKGALVQEDKSATLVQEDKSATLATNNDQYLFQPVGIIDTIGGQAERGWEGEVAPTLKASHYKFAPCVSVPVCIIDNIGGQAEYAKPSPVFGTLRAGGQGAVGIPMAVYDSRGNGTGKIINTLTGDHNNRITDYSSVVVEPKGFTMQGFGDYKDCEVASGLKARDYKDATDLVTEAEPISIDRSFFNSGQNAKYDPQFYTDGIVPTLVARGPSAVQIRYIVRRLTPTECARLQGFADRWGHIEEKDSLTPEEFRFWHDVRNTHAVINGKKAQDYTEKQILAWYNKLWTDSAEYKMWGNGIALPPALYCMQGIVDALDSEEDDAWML